MERRWVKRDGKPTVELRQEAKEVQAILDANATIRNNPNHVGGTGSKNQRCVARVPMVLHAKWVLEWRRKGMEAGTGMKANEYALFKASVPDYAEFITTPSGKTGTRFEKEARKLAFGYQASKIPVLTKRPKSHSRTSDRFRRFEIVGKF